MDESASFPETAGSCRRRSESSPLQFVLDLISQPAQAPTPHEAGRIGVPPLQILQRLAQLRAFLHRLHDTNQHPSAGLINGR
jgi:hypothetical protein